MCAVSSPPARSTVGCGSAAAAHLLPLCTRVIVTCRSPSGQLAACINLIIISLNKSLDKIHFHVSAAFGACKTDS